MRSTFFLAALAAGAVDAFEKRVYVTDWTTVTVTETVTAPAVTLTVPAAQQNQQPMTTSSIEATTTTTAAPQVSQAPAAAIVNDIDNSDNSALATKSPTPEVALGGYATTTGWYSAWTTTWGGEAPASTFATSSSTAKEPAATPSTPYQEAVLHHHNIHRSNHSASALEWKEELEESARKLADKCVYEHNTDIDGGGYGQNIGYGTSAEEVGVMLTKLMYNKEYYFFPWGGLERNQIDMSKFDAWGHLSQMVWKATRHVGCATVVCPSLGNAGGSNVPFTVCNYSPAGNMAGGYRDNVGPGLGHAFVSG